MLITVELVTMIANTHLITLCFDINFALMWYVGYMVNHIGLATLFQIDQTTFMCRQRTNKLTGKRII